ncbi:MAG: flagellar basal body-associated FliL family protein [Phycisphaerae bacterium]|nr:flagellar basal body-associated FliL family protein [Phycisphaerae bacterium]
MAKEQKKQEEPEEQTEENKPSEKKAQIVTGSIVGGIILAFAVAGFFLGKVLVDMRPKPIVMAGISGNSGVNNGSGSLPSDQPSNDKTKDPRKTWFYEMQPVLANLDEPSASRYVRATLTLEIYSTLSEEKGRLLLEEKERNLRDWLTIFLAGLSLDDARGEKNLKRIQAQVLEAFNEKLFPNAEPQIGRILLEGFAIQ